MDKVGACTLIRIFTVRLIRSVLLAVAGADLLWEKSIVGWLVAGVDLVWEKSIVAGNQQNRVI